MELVQKYVQGLADMLSAESAAALIVVGGPRRRERRAAGTRKAAPTAALGGAQGTVFLDANRSLLVGAADARKRAYFNWQWSGDGGQTWNSAPSTPYAHTQIAGLTLLHTYSFRVSATVAEEPAGPWSQAVSLLVH